MRPLRLAWLGPYPATAFTGRPALSGVPRDTHPAPWMTVQAPLMAAVPGVELHVVTVSRALTADDRFVDRGVHFHFLRVPRIPRAALLYQADRRRLVERVRRIAPDVVTAFGIEESYGYAALASGYPTVTFIGGIQSRIAAAMGPSAFLRRPWLLVPMSLERRTVRRCAYFITPTQFAERFVRGINPSARTWVIRTPVRDAFFSVRRPAESRASMEILFVGSLIEAKGVDILLRAFAEVARRVPSARLRLLGARPDARYFSKVLGPLAADPDVTGRVSFEGQVGEAEVAAAMAGAALLVLPTRMDTAPNVVVEAQVVGTPVLASRVGGIPDMVEDGVTGLLCPPGDSRAVAAGIVSLMADRERAERMAAVARERARPEYRGERQVAKLAEMYREIADGA